MSVTRRLINALFMAMLLCGSLTSARAIEELPIGQATERHLPDERPFQRWMQDPQRIEAEQGDVIELREKVVEQLETVKLTNVVPHIRFESGLARIPATTVESIAAILERMRDSLNVRLHFVGHADDRPLSAALQEIYGDNAGLSRERAGQVAEHFQTALGLPAEAISFDWAGATRPIASNQTEQGRALNRRVEVEVWYDEIREGIAHEEVLVPHQVKQFKVCRMETVCKLRYIDGHSRRARIRNLVTPLRYGPDGIDIEPVFVESVRRGFENLRDKDNVVVRFVGFTDNMPLAGRTERIYGDHDGLSRARARRVALAVQDMLGLPSAAVQSDGRGASKPLAANDHDNGRAKNRRVEVEFWYDDPLQDLPDEPQLCPDAAGAEVVTETYDPPWGRLANIGFVNGEPQVPEGLTDALARALAEVADKTNPRLRFIGYTRNERLERRTASVYGDDIGLSAARARRARDKVANAMQLRHSQSEFEGRGYVQSDDVVNVGFIDGEDSHVAVQVVYDKLAVLDDYDGVDIKRITRELSPENPLGLNLMRITVDGKPINDPNRSSSDIQRCTDVALSAADIQFGFDNLRSAPRLGVTAKPDRIAVPTSVSRAAQHENGKAAPDSAAGTTDANAASEALVQFRMYTNYSYFIERAEIRLFDSGESVETQPLAVIEIGADGIASWRPPFDGIAAPVRELSYVLRAYSADGNFDETHPQSLLFVRDASASTHSANAGQSDATLAGYGESGLRLHNIQLGSGTVTVRGEGIGPGETVWVAGRAVPVDADGQFLAETILPEGMHTVEVAVIDDEGRGQLYLRDLELKNNDWFYAGMADLTLSHNSANGPAELLQGANAQYDYDSWIDGRLAFFVDGKFGEHWKLTASADTREGPVGDLLGNVIDKSPAALLRRIDPDYHYPSFGDDATVEELTPSSGKLFVRLARDDDYAQFGNFKVSYANNELAQVERGLYGANLHYQAKGTTAFGDRRFALDAFTAEAGTVASREEFRGTGGSLYFLNNQDILAGSERVRIELRDKASGIVTGVVNLTPLEYDIDYLQGRILLAAPLASSAADNLLVRSGSLSADQAFLVVRYEHTPGLGDLDAMSSGGQAHYWVGDRLKLGLTASHNHLNGTDTGLNAADVTLRLSADSWVKLQTAMTDGLESQSLGSVDGGFGFAGYDPASFANTEAQASRVDISIGLDEFVSLPGAKLTLYGQDVEAGYSAPGLSTLTDQKNFGGRLDLTFRDRVSLRAKMDNRMQERAIETRALELNAAYQVSERWELSAGYRMDERTDNSVIVPLTQQQGERADAVMQVAYDPGSTWNAYLFAQDTLSTSGDRRENSRAGVGGSFQLSKKLRLEGELSDGDLGEGVRLGTHYAHTDHTSLYLNYALENERTDNDWSGTRGSGGSLVTGIKSRLADSTSVYLEERYQHGETMTGLTHATGVSFAPNNKWNFGLTTDIGTLEDVQTGAETRRVAGGLQFGFSSDRLGFSSGVEYRNDDVQQFDLARNERTTWLFRNNFKYRLNESARLLGKFNHSESENSQGAFHDGGFTEAVFGYAYRPVHHDRLNTLVKYTYFYNMPTTGQVGARSVSAEFLQKSHIAAVDVTYDLSHRLSLGGKYAYRLGQVSLDRDNPVFFDNGASLYVLRGDLALGNNWELLAEGRLVDMTDLNEQRSGMLVAVSRLLGDHIKLGLGYNFTDFSDDLTDLSFDHRGLFFNVTGSL